MNIAYKTNGVTTTKRMTKWYFGKAFVKDLTASAMQMHEKSGWNISQDCSAAT